MTGNVTVDSGALLTIEPGVAVLFNPYTSMSVSNASLSAAGTPSNPIYFTSSKDASAGGSGTPAPADWGYFTLSAASATFTNVKMRYGGWYSDAMFYVLNGSTLAFSGGEVSYSNMRGIWARGASVVSISSVSFHDCQYWGLAAESSLVPVMASNTFSGVQGVSVDLAQSVQAPGNVFQGITSVAAQIVPGVTLAGFDNTVVGQAAAGALMGVDVLNYSGVSTPAIWAGSAMPYVLRTGNVLFSPGAPLTLTPGSVVKLVNAMLSAQGGLNAIGAAEHPIYFTSLKDDAVGGDTNGDGSTTMPAAGDWPYVEVLASSASFSHVNFRYGGQGWSDAMLYIRNGSTLTFDGGEVSFSAQRGLFVRDASVASLSGVRFQGDLGWGLDSNQSHVPVLSGNTFDSIAYGARIDMPQIVQASGNSFQNISAAAMEIDPGVTLAGLGNTTVGQTTPGGLMGVDLRAGAVYSPATWEGSALPYVMRNGQVTFNPGASLTLTAGAKVKLAGWSPLVTQGGLTAAGTAGTPVVFTSLKDDSIGGDTNGDGSATSPAPSDWPFVQVYGSSATLANVKFRYGGSGGVWNSSQLFLYDDSTATFTGGEVSYSANFGLYAQNRAVLAVSGVSFQGNQSWGVSSYNGQVPVLTNNVFSNTASGARIDTAQLVQAAGNTFQNISGTAMQVAPGVTLQGFDNAVAGAASPGSLMGVDVLAGAASSSATWEGAGLPYVVRSGNVSFGSDVSLSLTAGTRVKLLDSGLWLEGGLGVAGNQEKPVVFTSFKDDTIGGDSNGDGGATSPAPGDWSSVTLWGSRSTATLSNARLLYGGGSSGAMLAAQSGGSVLFIEGEVSRSVSNGISVDGSGILSVSSVTVSSNTTGILTSASRPVEVHMCALAGNSVAGLNNTDANAAQAQYNWWGSTSGPANAANPEGVGDAVVGNVDFMPFLQQPLTAQTPPTVLNIVFLDPSPTQSGTVGFQVNFSKAMDPAVPPALTYGMAAPYTAYAAAAGEFISATVWQGSVTIPSGAPDGAYFLRIADAQDLLHQVMVVSTQPFYAVDNTPPQAGLSSPTAGSVLGRPVLAGAFASDTGGIAQVSFLVNGFTEATSTAAPYSYFWDTRLWPDGAYSLAVQAVDIAGNVRQSSMSVLLNYAPPSAPAIVSPSEGFAIMVATINVAGTADDLPGLGVQLQANGLDLSTAAVANGSWQVAPATLPQEGNISLTAVAFEPRGFSQPSSAVNGVYSGHAPGAPELPSAQPELGGGVALSWSAPFSGVTPAFYRVYRSTDDSLMAAGEPALASLRVANNVQQLSYNDAPAADDLYFYGIAAVDGVGNESVLSDVVYALTDRTPPSAQVLVSSPAPLGVGVYQAGFILSETLSQPPLAFFTPPGGQPRPLNLAAVTSTLWQGVFSVTPDMSSGTAVFAFQGSDLAGNVGTAVSSAAWVIRPMGPVGTVTLSKASPVGTGDLAVDLVLDEPAVGSPSLDVLPLGHDPIPVLLTQVWPEDGTAWRGTLAISSDTGDGPAGLAYSAMDALGNVSMALTGGATWFVIDTVAPGEPLVVRANSLPGAQVLVTWSSPLGERPVHYHIYRDGVKLSTEVVPAPDGTGSYLDVAPEGEHNYEVTSLDLAGNESAPTDPVALARATPPSPPINVAAGFDAFNQVQVTWEAGSTDTAKFNLYRTTYTLTSLTGAPAPAHNAVSPFVDSPSFDAVYHYALTALDSVGNESALSAEATVVWDKGAPFVGISGVAQGGMYKTDVSPTYAAESLILDPASVRALLDGQDFVSGSAVSAEGPHTLTVSAANTVGHYSTATVSFTIDKTAPQISFSLAQNAAVTSTVPISVQVLVSDLHPGASAFTLVNHLLGTSGSYASGGPIDRNGQYTLTAAATDLAGNSSTATLSFSLQIGPIAPLGLNVEVGDSARLSWTSPEPGVVAYRVYRDGVRISQSLLPGTSFVDSGYAPGGHVYEVAAIDSAGVEGPKAIATVPAATLALQPLTLTRGFFDALHPTVRNETGGPLTVGPAALTLTDSAGQAAASATATAVAVAAGQSGTLEGVIATPVGLSTSSLLRVSVALPTDSGAGVFLTGEFTLQSAQPASPIIEVFPGTLVPGTLSPVQVRLYNRGSAAMDVVTAQIQNSTYAAVNDVSVQLRTSEGTVFAWGGLLQTGNGADAALVDGRQVFFVRVPPGQSFTFDPVRVLVPNTVVTVLDVAASVSTPTYSLPWQRLAGTRGYSGATAQGTVSQVPYLATAFPGRAFYDQGSSVTITGQALDATSGQPMPNAMVAAHVVSNGYERNVTATTDESGSYTATFHPSPYEAGLYALSASYPSVVTRAAQSTFTIVGLRFQYSDFSVAVAQNGSISFQVSLTNTGASSITGLSASTASSSGSGVSLALDPATLPESLDAGAQVNLGLTLSAAPTASSSTLSLTVTESHGFSRTLPIKATVAPAQVLPEVTPQQINIGMLAGETRNVALSIRNLGSETWQGLSLTIPALSWVSIQGGTQLGDIPPGGNANVSLEFAPPSGLANGTYSPAPLIQVMSQTLPPIGVSAAVAVTSSRTGDVLVSVINADQPKNLSGQGVPVGGAKVTLTSLDVSGLNFTAAADANGLASLMQVPSGKYAWRAEAKGFLTASGTTVIEPGMTNNLLALLPTSVVSYQWSVTPTTIQDRYDVTLSLVYRTDVPVPVITVDPPLAEYRIGMGQSAFGQYTVTNKGLVSIYDFELSTSLDDGMALELPFTSIPEIKPGQSIAVPYKVTFVHASDPCQKSGGVNQKGYVACVFDNSKVSRQEASHSVVLKNPSAECGGTGMNWSAMSGCPPQGCHIPYFGMSNYTLPPAVPNVKQTASCGTNPFGNCESGRCNSCPGTSPASGGTGASGGGPGQSKNSPDFSFTPYHHSMGARSSALGYGWYAPFFEHVRVSNQIYTLVRGDGSGRGFLITMPPSAETDSLYIYTGEYATAGESGGGGSVGTTGTARRTVYPAFIGPPGIHDSLISDAPVDYVSTSFLPPPQNVTYAQLDGTAIKFKWSSASSMYLPTQLIDRYGNTISYSRDASERLTRVTDTHGRYYQFGYNGDGMLTSVADQTGRQWAYEYDSAGDKTRETDPTGDATSYVYDSAHRITRITYPNGGVKTYAYDGWGRVTVESEDAGNNQKSYVYFSSDTVDASVTMGSTTVTDALGKDTVYVWQTKNGAEMITRVIDPAGGVTRYEYNTDFQLAAVIDPLGRRTAYSYDANGNQTVVTDAAGGTVQTAYEAQYNQPMSVTDAKANQTKFYYDGVGNLVQTQDALNNLTSYSYDKYGNVTAERDPLGAVMSYVYDGNGAMTSVTDPLGRTTSMTRDGLSRVTKNADPMGKETEFSYDALGNLAQVKDALNGITAYGYEPGRTGKLMSTLTDAKGHPTGFGYDTLGRLTSVTNALSQAKHWAYDKKDRLFSVTDAKGQTITFEYDDLGRLTARHLAEGDVTYQYDGAGNLTRVSNYNGSIVEMSYDSLNRLTQSRQTLPGGFAATIGYTYDANGNRTGMSTPWGSFGYEYDGLNRLTKVTNPQGKIFSFAYDAAGRRTKLAYPNGIETNYVYDTAGQFVQIVHKRISDNTAISFANYTYNSAGNRTSMTDMLGTHNYGYDNLHRLVSANHPAGSYLPIKNEAFIYDAVGNRLSDAVTGAYQYNNANRLLENSSFTYTYDDNGNQTSQTEKATNAHTMYGYDSEGRMAQVGLPGGEMMGLQYDALGRRVEKSSDSMSPSAIMRYVYDRQNIVAILDGDNDLIALFSQGLETDEPLEIQRSDGSEYFIHGDGLGSIMAHSNIGGQLVESIEYQAYGHPIFIDIHEGSPSIGAQSFTGSPFGFVAREFDAESGQYFLRARYYDPATGRFVQEDPFGLGASVHDGKANLFVYVMNNPLRYRDPRGLYPTVDLGDGCTLDMDKFTGCMENKFLAFSFMELVLIIGNAASLVSPYTMTCAAIIDVSVLLIESEDCIEKEKKCIAQPVVRPPKPKIPKKRGA